MFTFLLLYKYFNIKCEWSGIVEDNQHDHLVVLGVDDIYPQTTYSKIKER